MCFFAEVVCTPQNIFCCVRLYTFCSVLFMCYLTVDPAALHSKDQNSGTPADVEPGKQSNIKYSDRSPCTKGALARRNSRSVD
jgi:hypothetical protein